MITIITVCYNAANDLEQTILSVKGQKIKHKIEFIIIDGKSSDNTVWLLNKYNDVVDKYVSEKDSGIYEAMNKGWELAQDNSYILFLGAGDLSISLPCLNIAESSDIIFGNVLLGSNFLFISRVGLRLKMGNTIHHQAMLIKKSVHKIPPFLDTYKTYADFDLNQRLFKAGHSFKKVNEFVSYAKEGGKSSYFDTKESLSVVNKNFGVFWKILASIYYKLQGK